MLVSSVARAGLLAESRRSEAVDNTTQNQNEASSAVARRQQASSGTEAMMTRAPEESGTARMQAYVPYTPSTAASEESSNDNDDSAVSEANEQSSQASFARNAPTLEQISEMVRQRYELNS